MELAVTESTTPWQQAQVLRDQVAFLRQELHAIQELDDREIKQLTAQLVRALTELKKARDACQKAEAEAAALRLQQNAKPRDSTSPPANAALKKQLATLTQQAEASKSKDEQAQAQIGELRFEVATLRRELESAAAHHVAVETQAERANSEADLLRIQVQQTKESLATSERVWRAELAALKQRSEEHTAEATKAKEQLTAAQKEAHALREEASSYKSQLDKAQAELQQAQSELAACQEQLKQAKSTTEASSTELESLRAGKAAHQGELLLLQAELQSIKQSESDLVKMRNHLMASVDQEKAKADEYQSQVSGLQKEASDAKAEVDRLTKEVEKQRAAKHLALKQLQQYKGTKESGVTDRQRADALAAEVDRLRMTNTKQSDELRAWERHDARQRERLSQAEETQRGLQQRIAAQDRREAELRYALDAARSRHSRHRNRSPSNTPSHSRSHSRSASPLRDKRRRTSPAPRRTDTRGESSRGRSRSRSPAKSPTQSPTRADSKAERSRKQGVDNVGVNEGMGGSKRDPRMAVGKGRGGRGSRARGHEEAEEGELPDSARAARGASDRAALAAVKGEPHAEDAHVSAAAGGHEAARAESPEVIVIDDDDAAPGTADAPQPPLLPSVPPQWGVPSLYEPAGGGWGVPTPSPTAAMAQQGGAAQAATFTHASGWGMVQQPVKAAAVPLLLPPPLLPSVPAPAPPAAPAPGPVVKAQMLPPLLPGYSQAAGNHGRASGQQSHAQHAPQADLSGKAPLTQGLSTAHTWQAIDGGAMGVGSTSNSGWGYPQDSGTQYTYTQAYSGVVPAGWGQPSVEHQEPRPDNGTAGHWALLMHQARHSDPEDLPYSCEPVVGGDQHAGMTSAEWALQQYNEGLTK